jgi:hypothetical protein
MKRTVDRFDRFEYRGEGALRVPAGGVNLVLDHIRRAGRRRTRSNSIPVSRRTTVAARSCHLQQTFRFETALAISS